MLPNPAGVFEARPICSCILPDLRSGVPDFSLGCGRRLI
jgi:hypothetical protein